MDYSSAAISTPSHVPPELVRNFDWLDMQGETDPGKHFAKLDSEPDIFWTPHYGGHWVTTRYKEMVYIYTHPDEFSSRHATLPPSDFQIPLQEYDGELHKQFRRILQPYFTPLKIHNLEEVARELTVNLIEGFRHKGECEFVENFAHHMPITILMSLLGLPPEDRDYLMPLSHNITRFEKYEDKIAGLWAIAEYTRDKIIPARREKPGEDVFSAFMAAEINGKPIADEQIMGLGALLIAAGLDTVAAMLGFITWHLAEHPEQRRELREKPELITPALEEMLRRFSLANMCRVVARDMEFAGVELKKGEFVLVPLTRAAMDGRQYRNPEEVVFERPERLNLTFGRGAHQCIGAFLARTELKVFLQEWLARIPEFRVKPGFTVRAKVGSANAVQSLPLEWDPV